MSAYVSPEDEFNGWMFAITTLMIGVGLSGLIAAVIAAGVFLRF